MVTRVTFQYYHLSTSDGNANGNQGSFMTFLRIIRLLRVMRMIRLLRFLRAPWPAKKPPRLKVVRSFSLRWRRLGDLGFGETRKLKNNHQTQGIQPTFHSAGDGWNAQQLHEF